MFWILSLLLIGYAVKYYQFTHTEPLKDIPTAAP